MKFDESVQIVPSYVKDRRQDDEISLIEIVCLLIRRKKLILGITTVVVCIGLLYVLSIKKVYQVETVLYPPSNKSVVYLNKLQNLLSIKEKTTIEPKSKKPINKETVFLNYKSTLELMSLDADVHNGFTNELNLVTAKFDNGIRNIRITSQSVERDKLKPWLDSLVEKANHKTVGEIADDLQLEIDLEIIRLKSEIKSKQSIFKNKREDTLNQLKTDYHIAKKLGITEHLFIPSLNKKSDELILEEVGNIKMLLSNPFNLSGYLKGTKILQAEIDSLENRTSDDSYISGIRNLEFKLQKLEKIKIDKSKLSAVTVLNKAVFNTEPLSPSNKMIILIITLSLIFGLLLSLFTVFLLDLSYKLKQSLDGNK